MKRKFLLFLTGICLAVSTVAAPLKSVSAETAETERTESATTGSVSTEPATAVAEKTAPKIGDVMNGFELSDIGNDAATKSTEYLFIHKKTGAKLLVMKNKDKNRGFSVKFNTPADDDKGINHIIEHSVLGGSKKYPSNNIIFDLSNTTYTSFANACTYQNMTAFPICSESEEQLLKSADIYLDAVYHPLLLSDERIFEREGWRYELADPASKLTCNGIVYNEMLGNMGSIENVAYNNAMKAIFPDSNQGNNSGGDPKNITNLTYQEVIDTYKKYYHPSNSFMVLYGDVDYETFMKMIDDNYLSAYHKQTTTLDRSTQKAFDKLSEKTYTFPVAKGKVTKNKAVIDLVFAASDIKKLGFENYVGLDIVTTLLNLDSSNLKKAMLSSNIAESYRIELGTDTYQPTIHFIAVNADPSKKLDFCKLIIDELKKVVNNGLDTELVKSSLRSFEFKKALGSDGRTAVNSMLKASMYDNLSGKSLVTYDYNYKKVVSRLDQKILEKLIQKYIVDNKTAALAVTIPKEGLLEKNEKAAEKVLAKTKSAMTKKQIAALVKKTADFKTWNSKQTPEDVLKSLQAVSIKELPTEIRDRNIKESNIDGAKLMTADADVDLVSSVDLMFDLSHLTPEELLYLKFYSDMLRSGMATDSRTENQVLNDTAYKVNSISTSVTALMGDKNDTSAHPVFSAYYFGFEDEYADTFNLVSDILLKSKVSDITTYGTRAVSNIKADYQWIFAEPITLALRRSMAYTSPTYRYTNYIEGLDYYNFILSLEKLLNNNPAAVAEKIAAVRAKAFNKNNLTVLFAGNTKAQEKFAAAMPEFTKKLPEVTYPKAVYTLPVPAKREGLTINAAVQYVCVSASLSANNVPISGKSEVITGLLNNLMMTPEIRLKGGAYGAYAYTEANSYFAYTFRDANYANSLITIGGTDEFLKALSGMITEKDLESYQLSGYAYLTQGSGEINAAFTALTEKCQGITTQDRINTLEELKQTSVADLLTYADYMEKINSNSNYVVVASQSEIDKHKDLFDVIIPLQ